MKKRIVIIALAIMMLSISIAVGTTLAWLMDETDPVENTFTVGDINIKLDETTGSDYKIIPGGKQDKDPTVTVNKGSEDCYVYVLIDNTVVLNGDAVAIPNVGTEWEVVATSGTKTLYRYNAKVLSDTTNDQTLPVFTEVSYSEEIEKGDIDTLNGTKITIKAYAHQASDNLQLTDIDSTIKELAGIS